MPVREKIQTLWRRRGILACGLVLTAIGGWIAIHPTPTYQAVAVITLRPPRTESTPNQFNDGRPSIALTGALIAARLRSPSGDAALRRAGVRGRYEVAPRNSGTTATPAYLIASVQISVAGTDPDGAARSVRTIIDGFGAELDALQVALGIPDPERLRTVILAPPSVAAQQVIRSRALLGAGLLGGVASILAALWCDRRRERPDDASPARRRGRYQARRRLRAV